MKRRTQQVWILVFPDSELLDVSGPWSVLGYANEAVGREVYRTRLLTPAGGEVRTRHGLSLGGALSLEGAGRLTAPDMLVVAGAALTKGLSAVERAAAAWLGAPTAQVARAAASGLHTLRLHLCIINAVDTAMSQPFAPVELSGSARATIGSIVPAERRSEPQRLQQRAGRRAECAINDDLRDEWTYFLEQTPGHVAVLTRTCEAVGISQLDGRSPRLI
jgi:hypothetical protein